MGPSEIEIEDRLAELRRRREAIDREIADLLLYLELGRRLGAAGATPAAAGAAPAPELGFRDPRPPGMPGPDAAVAPAGLGTQAPLPPSPPAAPASSGPAPMPTAVALPDRPDPAGPEARTVPGGDGALGGGLAPPGPAAADPRVAAPVTASATAPPAIAFADDPTGARRYGRALVAAACAVIAEARRPLHVSAILPHLEARGFTVPGRDPIAALNTRLWKRSGPDGPLRRLGDATYALAEYRELPGGRFDGA